MNGHGVYDCCEICGRHVKYDGCADENGVYHVQCAREENLPLISRLDEPESE